MAYEHDLGIYAPTSVDGASTTSTTVAERRSRGPNHRAPATVADTTA